MNQPALAGPRPFTSDVTSQALLKNAVRLPSRLPLLIIPASSDANMGPIRVYSHDSDFVIPIVHIAL